MNAVGTGEKIEAISTRNKILLVGSILTLVFSLLAAFIPNLAYVGVYTDFLGRTLPELGLPRVDYPSFEFSSHMFTLKFAVLVFASVLGLFSLFGPKNKRLYLIVASIVVANVAFWVPPAPSFMTIPEVNYASVPWTGCLLVLAGISIVFIGFAVNRPSVPQFTFLSVPVLLGVYSVYPLVIASGDLSLIGNLYIVFFLLSVAGHLLMIWGCLAFLTKFVVKKT